MKNFTKPEIISLVIIFLILIGVSWPNFSLSLRRARDQVRRDDIGNIQAAIDEYYGDYGVFPLSTPDGRIIACKGPGGNQIGSDGKVKVNLVACSWGKDAWVNLTPGVNKVYMGNLSGDPNRKSGAAYDYFSDGSRYQLMASLEGTDEPEYDSKLFERGVKCGNRICNMGRVNNVPLYMTIEEYDLIIICSQHPEDARCLNRQISK